MKGPVLITGGAGSVGKGVARRLCEQGRTVRVFDLPDRDFTGLEGEKGVEILRGDLTEADAVKHAAQGVSAVIHLAALLPLASEKNRELTFSINVDGTTRLAEALKRSDPDAFFVFSSSVATYGDTTGAEPPVTVDHPQRAIDIYAESKIAAERSLRQVCPQAVIIRISGISVPAIQSPPEVWPFMPDQRIEFIHREDVVAALCAAAGAERAKGQVFNIAGGATWQTTGREYVKDYYDLLGVPVEEARFQDSPGWCDWYDTQTSQNLLQYQNTAYPRYLGQLQSEVEAMMGE